MAMDEKWIGLEEAAAYLGVGKDTVRNLIKMDMLPAHKVGHLWKFKRSEIDQWVKAGKCAFRNGE